MGIEVIRFNGDKIENNTQGGSICNRYRLKTTAQAGRTSSSIAVRTAIAGRPPHRSVRAELPHTALTLDVDWQTLHLDKDVGSSASVTIDDLVWRISPT